ncbi:MAG: glycosyltransferase [Nitrospirota bacterium]|nr:glycosyltransferase [Nitrospirota bacterium]
MRICYFGTYSGQSGYPMNRVLLAGLEQAGAQVITCHQPVWADAADKMAGVGGPLRLVARILRLTGAWARLAVRFARLPEYDLLIVGYVGHLDIVLARFLSLFRRRPVVLNALISLYDTVVLDRRLLSPANPLARLLWWLDRTAFQLADAILIDTHAHARHLSATFGVPDSRWIVVPVGADPEGLPETPPPPPSAPPVRVLYFGTYIALHGVPTILTAARELATDPGIHFRMVGRGQELAAARGQARGLDNVEFVERWMEREELLDEIAAAHICLGVFGTGSKSQRVIPCKVFDALAMGRPVVTADNPAVRELLGEELFPEGRAGGGRSKAKEAILVPPGDSRALVAVLRQLAADPELRTAVGAAGYRRYRSRCTAGAIGGELLAEFRARGRGTGLPW